MTGFSDTLNILGICVNLQNCNNLNLPVYHLKNLESKFIIELFPLFWKKYIVLENDTLNFFSERQMKQEANRPLQLPEYQRLYIDLSERLIFA